MNARRTLVASGFIVLVLGVLGFGLWYQFFRDDAPPEVSLAAAVESVDGATTTDTNTTAAADGLDGSWAVSDGSDSFVGYRIGEELASIGTTEAVGRTSSIDGAITIDDETLTEVTLTVDMTSLKSDESRRDQALQRQSLETGSHPTATFELTEPIALPASLTSGEATTITATGNLTLHGVTQEVQIPLDVQFTDGTLVVVGSLDIALADYQIDPPRSPSVVSVNDTGVLELQLFLGLAA